MNIIELHDRVSKRPLFVNIDRIDTFQEYHHPAEDTECSSLYIDGKYFDVSETKEQILLSIIKATSTGKVILSEQTIKKYREIAPHSLW